MVADGPKFFIVNKQYCYKTMPKGACIYINISVMKDTNIYAVDMLFACTVYSVSGYTRNSLETISM